MASTYVLVVDDELLSIQQSPEQAFRAGGGGIGVGEIGEAAVHFVGIRQAAERAQIGLTDDCLIVDRETALGVFLLVAAGLFQLSDPLLDSPGLLGIAGFAVLLQAGFHLGERPARAAAASRGIALGLG